MGSTEVLMVGGGLVLAGFGVENLVVHRWLRAPQPPPVCRLTVMAVLLPVTGLAFMALRAA